MNSVAQIYFTDKDISDRWLNIKSDFEGELKQEAQRMLKRLMETSMELEVQDLIGPKWAHSYQRTTYRNGYRRRNLLSSFGYLADIQVPRLRSGNIPFKCFERYKQRTKDVDHLVLNMFLSGVSTRRVKEVFAPLLGSNTISASSVSQITKTLNSHVNKYHSRQLQDDYLYLFADGVYFNVKNPVWKKRRCVLVVYGIKANGVRELIDFELAPKGESEASWERFFYRLAHRGLHGSSLRLIIRDGNNGLKNALATVFPNIPQQPCWAHKLRNVSNKLPRKLQTVCVNQARNIYNAPDAKTALKSFKAWAKAWNPIAPLAVQCLNDDILDLLNFFNEPKHLWRRLRTTNSIERNFREVRRRTRPMSCFQIQNSIQRIIFAIFYRQNRLWESKPLKITHLS